MKFTSYIIFAFLFALSAVEALPTPVYYPFLPLQLLILMV